jgi:lipid-A-disaccharide synthase
MREMIFKNPIFICAGEPSGDMYAALLIKRLKKTTPNLKIYGVGGDKMRKSGVEVVEDYNKLMAFGFSKGILSSFRNYKVYKKKCRAMYRVKAKTFIAVAYPGINLLLCKYAKRLGCKVYYFLPPQIWAWGEFRKYFIKKWVDRVISVFPFEHEFYKKRGVKVDYLENPLFEELKRYKRGDFKKRIGFMPGSRSSEIKRNLPVMIEIMRKIGLKKHDLEFFLILHPHSLEIAKELIARSKIPHLSLRGATSRSNLNEDPEQASQFHEKYTKIKRLPRNLWSLAMTKKDFFDSHTQHFKVITEKRYQVMKNCDLLIVCSGTASLEAAIMNIRQIFFNRPSFFDYYFAKRFLKIKEYNLTNLYFNKKMVPSFVARNTGYILQNSFDLIDDYIS